MTDKPFEAYQGVEPFLFASYAHADDAIVYPELRRLHESGYRIWYDEGISPSDAWPESISRSLLTSKLVIVYLSPRALASKWVMREIRLAVKRELKLLPIYLEPLPLTDELEFQIGHIQAIERHSFAPDAYFRALMRELDKIPDINRTAQEAAVDRVQRELDIAARIQQSMIPKEVPALPEYSFWATIEPCSDGVLAGDAYDFHTLPTGEILVLVADTSGHGVSAALGMAALQGMIAMAVMLYGSDLTALLQAINRSYYQRMSGNSFVTLTVVALDVTTNQLRAVSAGAGPGFIRRQNGAIEPVVPHDQVSMPIGVVEALAFEQVTCGLAMGDAVFLYTDGITEAMNSENQLYGNERLKAVLQRAQGDAPHMGEAVLADMKLFVGMEKFRDDATAVCFTRRRG